MEKNRFQFQIELWFEDLAASTNIQFGEIFSLPGTQMKEMNKHEQQTIYKKTA